MTFNTEIEEEKLPASFSLPEVSEEDTVYYLASEK